jgi:hypothetical protein
MKIIWGLWILFILYPAIWLYRGNKGYQKDVKDNQKYVDAGVLVSVIEEGSNIVYYYDYYGKEIMGLRRKLKKGEID